MPFASGEIRVGVRVDLGALLIVERELVAKSPRAGPLRTEFVAQYFAGRAGHHQMKSVDVLAGQRGDGKTSGKNGARGARNQQSKLSHHGQFPCPRLQRIGRIIGGV
jgi:hypothetical protein